MQGSRNTRVRRRARAIGRRLLAILCVTVVLAGCRAPYAAIVNPVSVPSSGNIPVARSIAEEIKGTPEPSTPSPSTGDERRAAAPLPSGDVRSPSPTPGPVQKFTDIPYFDSPDADRGQVSLDVYTRAGARDLPIAVFVHGGGWSGGDKSDVRRKDDAFLAAGYLFVSVNYRLLPAGRHPTNAQDVARALAWIYRNAGRFGGDPDRIYVIGHSAGAHLSALVATDERYLRAAGESLSIIKGVVALDSAAYDVARLLPQLPDPNNLYAQAFGADRTVWADASPTSHIARGRGIPPFLVVHANHDAIRNDQAQRLAALLRGAGVRADLFDVPERDHGALCDLIGAPNDRTTQAIIDFLGSLAPGRS